LSELKALIKSCEQPADCVIEGQLFATTRGGEVKLGAGRKVVIKKEISQYNILDKGERFQALISSPNAHLSAEQIEWKQLWMTNGSKFYYETTVDAQGNFRAYGLTPGAYTLTGGVYWDVVRSGTGGGAYTGQTGGDATATVTVGINGHPKITRVMLTP